MGSEDDAECLGLETIAQLISKEPRGARLAELEGHVARCTRCQQLIAAAAYGAEDVDSKAPSVTALGGGQRVERFASGDVIAGRFEVRRFIARGGMGEVYDVDDRELGARIALKVMAVEARAEPEALARFRREVALARSVTHPNVCRVFDVGFHSRQGARVAFMTMELLSGETLSARLRRVGRIPFERALPIVRDVCAGLSAAHSAGVIHRDFKSSNVILEGDDASLLRAVITDFGLACLHEGDATLTRRGQVLGTPATMAPEQILAEGITAATDVYALGCVLFEMFSGTLPFASSNATASLSLRLTQPAPLLRSRAPEAPAHCESVVARCLERAQERRFQTVEEVLTGLESGASTRAPLLRRTKVAQVAAALAACAATGLSVWWAARDRLPSAALSPMPALAGGSDVVQTGAPLLARGSAGTPQRLAIFPPRDDTYLGMNEREGVGHTTTNIGSILFEEGALKEARSAYEEALAIHGAVGARLGEGYEHIQIARVAQAAGDLREARERCQRGRSILESLSDRAIVADALLALSDIHRDEDDVASARQAASDALDIDRALGDWPASHDAQLQLARLALDEGDGATGARRADAVVSEPGSSPAQRALAHALRARAFVLAGKLADADAATALAANAAATLQGFISPAEVRLLTAEQRARAGWQKEAIDTAREVLAQARAKGHVKLSFEARLLLVRLNPRDSAQSRALSIAARAQQFARIARLAKASPRALGR